MNGLESKPRNELCREIYFERLDIDPHYPIIDYEARKFPYHYLAGELSWYLLMDRKTDYIKNFSKFWDNLKNDEGDVNSNYGYLLFPEQLNFARKELIKDKYSRRAIAFISRPEYQSLETKDFICSMYLNFFIREDTLNMSLKIRSNDIIYGLTYDAPFFSFVLQHMYLWLKEIYPELKLGTYIHQADNIHYYERHFEMVDKILRKTPSEGPRFEVIHPMFYYKNDKYIRNSGVDELIEMIKNLRSTQYGKDAYIEALSPWIKITN